MRQEIDPNSVVDRDYDLYVEDLDSDDSEYGSYCYASVAMPTVQDMIPNSFNRPLRAYTFP